MGGLMKIKIHKDTFEHNVRDHVTVRLTSLSWGYDDNNPKDNWFNWNESPESNTAILNALQKDWRIKDGIIEAPDVWYADCNSPDIYNGYLYMEIGYTKRTKKCLLYFADLNPDDIKKVCHCCGQEIKEVSDD